MPKDHLPEVGPNLQKLRPELLYTDGGTQPRGRLDDAVVDRYADEMQGGLWDWAKSSTSITVFFDGKTYWLGDGFHRVAAAKKAGLDEVEVDVRQGGEREAKWFSFGVNAEHGHARGKDDVARILTAIFEDAEWQAIPLREIARHTRVPLTTVHRYHDKHVASVPPEQIAEPVTRTVIRGGTTYDMDTSAIGKPSVPPELPAAKLDVETAEVEGAGDDEVNDVKDAAQTADDAKPAAKPSEAERKNKADMHNVKVYLRDDNLRAAVHFPARLAAAAVRRSALKTSTDIRRRVERYRQWTTEFLAALDEANADQPGTAQMRLPGAKKPLVH